MSTNDVDSGTIEPQPPRARKLRVIGKAPLAHMLDVAVLKALREVVVEFDSERVDAVQRRVRSIFGQLIHTNGQQIRGVPKSQFLRELQESRDRIQKARDRAGSELSELKQHAGLLREVRSEARVSEDRERSEINARLADAERELGERFRAILANRAGAEPAVVGEELARAAGDVMRAEAMRGARERALRTERQIEQFERRIAKLTQSLESTEAALGNLSKLKSGDSEGIQSIYRTVQGLEQDVEDFAVKRAALEQIFTANLSLQTNMG